MEVVELGSTTFAVTEETGTNALPIAGTHLEILAGRQEVLAVNAVVELVTVVQTVVGDSKIKRVEMSCLDNLLPSAHFRKDTLRTEANGPKLLARAAETGIATPLGREQRRTLTLISYHFLRQHIPTSFQTVGRQGMQREKTFALGKAPAVVLRIVVPLPLQAESRIREVIASMEYRRL